jgi:hypothetical protein
MTAISFNFYSLTPSSVESFLFATSLLNFYMPEGRGHFFVDGKNGVSTVCDAFPWKLKGFGSLSESFLTVVGLVYMSSGMLVSTITVSIGILSWPKSL